MPRFHSLLTSFFLLAGSVLPLASASAATTITDLDLTGQGNKYEINGSSEAVNLTGTLTGGADQEIYFTSIRGNFLYLKCTDVSGFSGTLTAGPSTNTSYGTWIVLNGATTDFSTVTFNPNPGTIKEGADAGKSIDAGILIEFDPTGKTLQIGAISGDGIFRSNGNSSKNKTITIKTGAKNIDTTFSGSFSRYDNSNYAIEKVGTGTWTITSDYTTYYSTAPVGAVTKNNYTGDTTITAGTIQIGNGGTVGHLGTSTDSSKLTKIIIRENGTLAINRSGAFTFYNNIQSSGTLKIMSTSEGASTTLAGTVTGTINKTGGGTLLLAGGNATGVTEFTVTEGTLAITDPSQLGDATKITIGENGTLGITSSTGAVYPQTIESAGAIQITSAKAGDYTSLSGTVTGTINKTGNGTLRITENNFTDVTKFTVTEGKLQFGNGEASSNCAYTTNTRSFDVKSGGTLAFKYAIPGSGDLSIYGNITSDGGNIEVSGTGGHLALRGSISGSFVKTGTGNLALGSKNGSALTKITIKEGTLRNYYADRLGDGATEIELNGGSFAGADTQVLSNTFTVTANSTISVFSGKTLTLSGPLTTTNGQNINIIGGGTLNLTGTNSLTGSTIAISNGTLAVTDPSQLGGASKITIGQNGTLGITSSEGAVYPQEIQSAGTIKITSAAAGDYTSLSGTVTGTINKTGNGTLLLTGGDATGETQFTVTEGKLQFGNGEAASTFAYGSDACSFDVKADGTLAFNYETSDALEINGNLTSAEGGTIEVTDTGTGYVALKGSVTGEFIKTGTGALAVESSNGDALTKITIKEGTLRNSAAEYLGNGTTEIVLDGGTFQEMNNVTLSNKFTIQSDSTIDIPENITTYISSDIDKVEGQTDIVTKTGKGTLVFTGANEFTGGYIINGGTIQCGNNNDGHINNNASVTVNSGAAFGYNRAADSSVVKPTNVFTVNGGKLFNSGARAIEFQNVTMQSGGLTLENTGTSTLEANVKSTDNGVLTFNGTTDGDITANVNGSSAAQYFGGLASSNNVKSTINFTSTTRGNFMNLNGSMSTFSGDINLKGECWFAFNSGAALGSEKASFNLSMTKDTGLLLESSDLNDKTIKMGDLTGVGWVRAGNGGKNVTLEIGVLGNDSTFSGSLINYKSTYGLTVKKVGNGNWTFASANQVSGVSYNNTANVIVDSGTLTLNRKANQASANNITVNNGATLVVAGQSQKVSNLVTLNSGSVLELDVTGAALPTLTAKTLDIKDGAKIEIEFSDSANPFAIGTLELLTADDFKVNGTSITSDDAMKSLLETYVEVNADWAQISYIPHGTAGYTVLLQTNFNAVPEPAAWLLTLLGFAGLGVLRKRRR